MTRKGRSSLSQGYQGTISDAQFLAEHSDASVVALGESKAPMHVVLYVCPQCGWWKISDGMAENLGNLPHKAESRTGPCGRCLHAPLYQVRWQDLLRVVPEAKRCKGGYDAQ